MIFTEPRFFLFFLLVFGVHWALRGNGVRKLWLLAASYAFYGAWDARFLALIAGSTALDFVCGSRMTRPGARRRTWLTLSLLGNLGSLGFFKYYDFFVESAADLAASLGAPWAAQGLDLVLPVGISFYTFQSLSYTIDVYRGRLQPVRRFSDFALFVSFFPQLVAGPIVRALDLLPQLVERRSWADVRVRACLTLFLFGFVKKACVADSFSAAADPVFADPAAYTMAAKWVAALLYTVQIYCDFSGYSDMAIAVAGLLGYHLPINFDFPYCARSITDFWRRWHISLSSWFRDYLYIPLGGNRRGVLRTYANPVTVFFPCGLWHGASWNFVVWGLYHGAFLVVERILSAASGGRSAPAPVRHVYVLMVAVLGWVVFRAENLEVAHAYLAGMFGYAPGGAESLRAHFELLLVGFALVHLAMYRKVAARAFARLPDWGFALVYGAAVALTLPWVSTEYQPFIYFQF